MSIERILQGAKIHLYPTPPRENHVNLTNILLKDQGILSWSRIKKKCIIFAAYNIIQTNIYNDKTIRSSDQAQQNDLHVDG